LAELKCGQNELKLGKKEVTKMTQTLKQSTLKDLPATYIKEIIATMQKMTIAQDRVNENLVKAIIEIVRSLPKKPHWEAMETPKAMKTIKSNPFWGKDGKFKRIKEWFPLLEAYSKHKLSPYIEKMRVVQSLF
jgi:hypothetical protein